MRMHLNYGSWYAFSAAIDMQYMQCFGIDWAQFHGHVFGMKRNFRAWRPLSRLDDGHSVPEKYEGLGMHKALSMTRIAPLFAAGFFTTALTFSGVVTGASVIGLFTIR